METPTTLYRTAPYLNVIEAYVVTKMTENRVTYQTDGAREITESRMSPCHRWHGSWESARAHLLSCADNRRRTALAEAAKARRDIAELKAMRPAGGTP